MKPVRLTEITSALDRAGLIVTTSGALPDIVTAITDDSREVVQDSLFVAVRAMATNFSRRPPAPGPAS
jgi:hypothetical protein